MAESRKLIVAAVVGAADVLIFQHFVPHMADVRRAEPMNTDIEKAERQGLFIATTFTLLVAGLYRSAEVFAVGGAVILGLDFATKHANAVNPQTGKVESAQQTGVGMSYPQPDYQS